MQSPLWILWAAVIVFALTNYMQRVELMRRLGRVEADLRAVAAHAGFNPRTAAMAEVAALVRAGRMDEAVRLYRQRTGATLLESREAVEEMGKGQYEAPRQ